MGCLWDTIYTQLSTRHNLSIIGHVLFGWEEKNNPEVRSGVSLEQLSLINVEISQDIREYVDRIISNLRR